MTDISIQPASELSSVPRTVGSVVSKALRSSRSHLKLFLNLSIAWMWPIQTGRKDLYFINAGKDSLLWRGMRKHAPMTESPPKTLRGWGSPCQRKGGGI